MWHIANEVRQGTVLTIDQAMLAIAGANPQAFINGNINRLKSGATLTIPNIDQISSLDSHLARREVLAHNKAWHQGTAINHVLQQPYIVAKQAADPVASTQPSVEDTPPVPAHMLVMQEHKTGVEWNPLLQKLSNNATDLEKKLSAELALALEASNKVQQTDEVLQEQLTMLQQQNQDLQNQVAEQTTELAAQQQQNEELKAQLSAAGVIGDDSMATINRPGLNGQAHALVSLGEKFQWNKLIIALFAAFGGGGIAAGTLALRRRRLAKNDTYVASSCASDTEITENQALDAEGLSRSLSNSNKVADMSAVAGDDLIATQLDLATAYVRMGEHEAACGILNEINNAGNEQQQLEVMRLLAEIDS